MPQLDTKTKIVNAGVKLFGKVGSSNLTRRAIAKDAKVSEALVSHHLGTVDAMRKVVKRAAKDAGVEEPSKEKQEAIGRKLRAHGPRKTTVAKSAPRKGEVLRARAAAKKTAATKSATRKVAAKKSAGKSAATKRPAARVAASKSSAKKASSGAKPMLNSAQEPAIATSLGGTAVDRVQPPEPAHGQGGIDSATMRSVVDATNNAAYAAIQSAAREPKLPPLPPA